MIDVKFYADKLKNISESAQNDSLKGLAKGYKVVLENASYKDALGVLNSFLTEANKFDLNESDKKLISSVEFKKLLVGNLGVEDAYNKIIEDCEFVAEAAYAQKLGSVKKVLEEGKPEYQIVESTIKILKTLPTDEVVNEQIQILEGNIESFQNDVRVLNIIDYLKASEDYSKYKATYDTCIEKLEDYLAEPNAYTRGDAIDCIRELNYDVVVKEFANYLSALNFEDDSYNHSVPVKGSPAAGRVYSGGYLEKWNKDTETKGLGKIVIESIQEAEQIGKDVNERTAVKLLVERLSTEKLNSIERKVFQRIQEDNRLFDMELESTLASVISESDVLATNLDIKKCVNAIDEAKATGTPEYKIVEQVYNTLSKYSFDPSVEKAMTKIQENYNDVEERILLENVKEYIKKNPRLGMFKDLDKDLEDYTKNPTKRKKAMISERYSKVTLDPYVKGFLNKFSETSSNYINPNPNEFTLNKAYSIVETIDNKHYFKLNGRFLVKDGDDINYVKENEVPERLKNLTNIFESLNMNVVNEWTVKGYMGGMSISVDVNENTGEKNLSINDRIVESTTSRDVITYVASQQASTQEVEGLFKLYENLDSLVELDFITRIGIKRDAGVYADLFHCNENYYINFINEHIKLNKLSKTQKASTLRDSLYEFMEFDITESLYEKLKFESSEVEELKKQARTKLREVELCEAKIEKLKTLSSENLNESNQAELETIIESIVKEIEEMKKDYARLISKITEAEDGETEPAGEESTEGEEEAKEEKPKEEESSKFSPGDTVSHKPSKRTGEVTACENSLTCTVKFNDGSIQTVKIEDLTAIQKQEEETE